MIGCVDVDYRSEHGPAVAAAIVLESLFRRELPCIRAVLAEIDEALAAVVVDGHVWLDDRNTPGLGAHLHRARGGAIAVVGVAKNRFHSTEPAAAVTRGSSANPLYVTAAGIDPAHARRLVAGMAGPHRIPSALKRVDRLCRDYVT